MKNIRLHALTVSTFALALAACGETSPEASNPTTPPPVEEAQGPIETNRADRASVAAAILESLARRDWQTLSTFVAPTGVRFTPYTHVNPETDRALSPANIASFDTDNESKTWGTEEGSGEPIIMTNMEYLNRYVWDHDYRSAPDVIWNEPQMHGSMIDNVQDEYPGASTVEYHFPTFDEQYGGMDWRSLRLVLAQGDDGNYVLHGVIHDEWTP